MRWWAGWSGRVHDNVEQGESITGPLRESKIFPAMVVGMVDVGEQTGAMPEMLNKIADNYDEEVDNAVSAMTSLLEPIMIVVLGVIVGCIVVALFLPIIPGGGSDRGRRHVTMFFPEQKLFKFDAVGFEAIFGGFEDLVFERVGGLVVGAPDFEGESDGAAAEGSDRTFRRNRIFGKLSGEGEEKGAGFFDVDIVIEIEGDDAEHALVHDGEIDAGLAGHGVIGDDDAAVVRRAEDGVAEIEAFDDADFGAGGGGDLHVVAKAEGAVEQKGNAGDEIAEGILGGEAEDHRDHADAGEPGVAHALQGRNEMRVSEKGKDVNNDAGKLAEKANGGRIGSQMQVAGAFEHALDREGQEAAHKPGEKQSDGAVNEHTRGFGGIKQVGRNRFQFVNDFVHVSNAIELFSRWPAARAASQREEHIPRHSGTQAARGRRQVSRVIHLKPANRWGTERQSKSETPTGEKVAKGTGHGEGRAIAGAKSGLARFVVEVKPGRLTELFIRMQKVLVIDDTEEVRSVIAKTLTHFGFEAREAKDGERGIQMALESAPDLIICDVRMPVHGRLPDAGENPGSAGDRKHSVYFSHGGD